MGKHGRVTLEDVAQKAGVSVGKVSHIMTGRDTFYSLQEIDRIKHIAAEIGFIPRLQKRHNSAHKSKKV